MKKIVQQSALCLFMLLYGISGYAQYASECIITDLNNNILKSKIEQNITRLLTEFNTAQSSKRIPELSECKLSGRARNSILSIWENSPFRCSETTYTVKCLKSVDGFQVRSIKLWMMPDSPDLYEEDRNQEAVINFTDQGEIANFQLAISNHMYDEIIKRDKSVEDLRCRQMILDYVEQFRTAYNMKDIEFLEQIFSEDALIITGKVVKRVKTDGNFGFSGNQAKVEYSVQSKKQYLSKLNTIFNANKRIHVVFDDLKLIAHPAKKNFYGVTLKQGYSSDSYSDIGYLFLLWDFSDPDAPKIHVRTWQPDKLDKNTPLPLDELFSVDDFDI